MNIQTEGYRPDGPGEMAQTGPGPGAVSGVEPSGTSRTADNLRPAVPLDERECSEPILQFFRHAHLPVALAEVAQPFWAMAATLVDHLPRNPERSVALRKLLEAKDRAVRAVIYKEP